MAPDAATPRTKLPGPLSPSHLGLVGQVATSWGVASGLLASIVVTAHVLFGQLSSSLGFLTASLFFVAGSVIGYLHGGIMGYLGRPADVDRKLALHRLALAALYAVPTMVAGWLVAMVLALSAASLVADRTLALLGTSLGWVAALGLLVWAAVETRGAVRNLCDRWPGARVLLVTLVLAFLALLPVFIITRPEVWVVGVRPTATTAALMALGATLWILGPLGVLGLLAVRAWSRRHPPAPPTDLPHGVE